MYVVYEMYNEKEMSFPGVLSCNVDLYMLHGSAGDGRCMLQKPYTIMN
jgi:hypothetical protein